MTPEEKLKITILALKKIQKRAAYRKDLYLGKRISQKAIKALEAIGEKHDN